MTIWRVNNQTALGGEVCAPWAPNHAYSLGARCVCRVAYATTARRAWVYECTTAGTSHGSTEPTWPASGTVNDNDIVWTARDPSDGSWDNASCYLHYVLNHTTIAAGDTVYVDDSHSESLDWASAVSLKGSATVNNPIKIICVDKATDALSTGAQVTSSNSTYGLRGSGFGYVYGVTLIAPSISLTYNVGSAACGWILEGSGSSLLLKATTAGGPIGAGGGTYTGYLILRNGNVELKNYLSYLNNAVLGYLEWTNGTLVVTDGDGIRGLILTTTANYCFRDLDLSAVGDGANARALVDCGTAGRNGYARGILSRCKFPTDAGFTVYYRASQVPFAGKAIAHQCSGANAIYDFYEGGYEGSIVDETTVVRTGGASDGTTPVSMKMSASANVLECLVWLESPSINGWTGATTEKTFTVEGILDSATNLQNDELWIDFEYPADNSSGLGAMVSTKCLSLATPTDLTASTETWGDGALTNPNKFKLSVTVTPGKAGPISARVYLAKASTAVYIDPRITES